MTVFRFLCLFLLFFLFGNIYSCIAQSNASLDSLATTYKEKYKLPGLAIAIVRPDTFYFGLDGHKRFNGVDPIQAEDLFHIGSNTKAFTAFLAAFLVEKGIVGWQDKLVDAVPELKAHIHPHYREISLQDLLSHRAGVAPFESAGSKEFRSLPRNLEQNPGARLAFAQAALHLPPRPFPDNGHLYSNGGYIIAGLMLERITGKSYESMMHSLAKNMGFQIGFGFPGVDRDNAILGHRKNFFGNLIGQRYRPLPPSNRFAVDRYFTPAGDLCISLLGFSHWIQDHLRGLLGEASFLSPESYQSMHYGLPGYGMGWYNGFVGNGPERFSYHGGSLGTFSSAVMLCAERKIGIIILVNAEGKAIQRLKDELRVDLWTRYGKAAKP